MGYFRLINLTQTKEERCEKYHLARSLGCNSYWANRMKDWRLIKIERLFGLTNPGHAHDPSLAPCAQFRLPGLPYQEDLT